eukprot:14050969-Alexandrium_andersonii.AAC.1
MLREGKLSFPPCAQHASDLAHPLLGSGAMSTPGLACDELYSRRPPRAPRQPGHLGAEPSQRCRLKPAATSW